MHIALVFKDFHNAGRSTSGYKLFILLKRYDVMMGAAIGVDLFDLLEVHMGYDWGLINRYRGNVADELKMTRNQFTLSVGIRF